MPGSKLNSLLTIGLGGSALFYAYNIYIGDYRIWSRHVMPAFLYMFPHAEKAHILAVKSARYDIVPRIKQDPEIKPYLKTKLWDIEFDNPVGLAAGFDKDGEAITGLSWFGFGFLEVGTVTPLPQKGNLPPRVFRYPEHRAIINRYGFNNLGIDEMEKNLNRQKQIINQRSLIVGVNLGANRNSQDKISDYLKGFQRFHENSNVRYFVINISSPNTPNLRNLQNKDKLNQLLGSILKEKKNLEQLNQPKKPLLVKLSPDMNDDQLKDVAEILLKYSKETKTHSQIDGMVISNTTISRPPNCPPKMAQEEGGLSGPPLKEMSTNMIRKMYRLTKGTIPIIGVGGIENGMDAFEKIKAGASLLQLYTSMVYFGPPVVKEIKYELAYILAQNGYKNVSEAVGADFKK